MRKDYTGVLTRDSREHFTFIEDASEKNTRRRYPFVFQGNCFSVTRREDGSPTRTSSRPLCVQYCAFKDSCREAAEELHFVAGFIEEEER